MTIEELKCQLFDLIRKQATLQTEFDIVTTPMQEQMRQIDKDKQRLMTQLIELEKAATTK